MGKHTGLPPENVWRIYDRSTGRVSQVANQETADRVARQVRGARVLRPGDKTPVGASNSYKEGFLQRVANGVLNRLGF